MEIDRDTDGQIAAQRCYEAIAEAGDLETGQALWRAFGKYHRKSLERTAGDYGCPLPRVGEFARLGEL